MTCLWRIFNFLAPFLYRWLRLLFTSYDNFKSIVLYIRLDAKNNEIDQGMLLDIFIFIAMTIKKQMLKVESTLLFLIIGNKSKIFINFPDIVI